MQPSEAQQKVAEQKHLIDGNFTDQTKGNTR